jgi:hypothetical protein
MKLGATGHLSAEERAVRRDRVKTHSSQQERLLSLRERHQERHFVWQERLLFPRKASLAIEIGALAQEKASLGVDGNVAT